MAFVKNSMMFTTGGGTNITVVANYSALPDPTTVSGQFYWCESSQGTSWLPGSLGGTYYSAGQYYSNGVSWSFVNVPYQATQSEVNTGTNTDKFVTPSTLKNSTQFQYLDATSSIQGQLDHRVRVLLNDNVDSTAVTGVTANTIIKSYLIPANTLAVGDTIDFKTVVSKTGTNASNVLRLATNTANSLTTPSAALTLATFSAPNTNRYLSLDRTYTLKTGNVLQSFPVAQSAVTDESGVANPPDSTAFNPAVDNYFMIAIQPNSPSDSFVQTLCYITLMKAKTTI